METIKLNQSWLPRIQNTETKSDLLIELDEIESLDHSGAFHWRLKRMRQLVEITLSEIGNLKQVSIEYLFEEHPVMTESTARQSYDAYTRWEKENERKASQSV